MADDAIWMDALGTLVAPWRWLTAPRFVGLERIPEGRPLLFVGNHTLMGGFDVPLLMAGLWERKRIAVHSLGDTLHFRIPGWRSLVASFGVIEGTRASCSRAMREGRALLVFPGGAREVTKRRHEKYQLLWGRRVGFARLAIEFGYTIVPFAAVGADDCWDILIDGDDILRSPIGGLVRRLHPRPDLLPPLIRGIGPTPLPRPERFYFEFADPLDASSPRYRGRHDDGEACFALREAARRAVEGRLASLLAQRERDPERSFGARVRRGLRRLV